MDVNARTRRQETVSNVYEVYKRLTPVEREYFHNGLGSEKWFLRWATLPSWVCKIFDRAVRFHDLGYFLGGNDEDRASVDSEFSAISLTDSYAATKAFFKRLFLRGCSHLALDAVRTGGGVTWEDRNRPLTYEELKAAHKEGLAKAQAEHDASIRNAIDKADKAVRRLREFIKR